MGLPLPFTFFPSLLPRTPKFIIRSSSSSSTSDAQTQTLPKSAIQRIADKLRTIGFTEDTPNPGPGLGPNENSAGEIFIPLHNRLPRRRVGHTMHTSWSTPENPVPEPGTGMAITRYNALRREVMVQKVMERKERKGRKEEIGEDEKKRKKGKEKREKRGRKRSGTETIKKIV